MLRPERVAEDDAMGEIIAKLILCTATDRMRESGVSSLAGARAFAYAAVAMCRSAGVEVDEVVAGAHRQVQEAEEDMKEPQPGARMPRRRSASAKRRAVGE